MWDVAGWTVHATLDNAQGNLWRIRLASLRTAKGVLFWLCCFFCQQLTPQGYVRVATQLNSWSICCVDCNIGLLLKIVLSNTLRQKRIKAAIFCLKNYSGKWSKQMKRQQWVPSDKHTPYIKSAEQTWFLLSSRVSGFQGQSPLLRRWFLIFRSVTYQNLVFIFRDNIWGGKPTMKCS